MTKNALARKGKKAKQVGIEYQWWSLWSGLKIKQIIIKPIFTELYKEGI